MSSVAFTLTFVSLGAGTEKTRGISESAREAPPKPCILKVSIDCVTSAKICAHSKYTGSAFPYLGCACQISTCRSYPSDSESLLYRLAKFEKSWNSMRLSTNGSGLSPDFAISNRRL